MSKLEYTSIDEIPQIHKDLYAGFRTGKTKPIAYRKEQLLQLAYLIQDNQARFQDALRLDLGRPPAESDLLELNTVIGEILEAYKSVAKWAAPEKAPFHPQWYPMSPGMRKEPKGVVLIIAPFNYPVLLLVGPFASAIAAGCAVLLKPSELVPNVSALLAELLPQYLDSELYRLVNGGVPETTKILELPWNHIMYTGNGRVAKIVSKAAAEHLTPVTLELGGKSPVVIDPKCDVMIAAKRILWGKVCNSGQTCLAPDYILVPRDFEETFINALKRVYADFYPTGPKLGEMTRMVNALHVQRVKRLLESTKGEIVLGGKINEEELFVEPTIVRNVKGDDSLMSEELFCPILPIITVKDVDEAIDFINSREHALALYVFSQDAAFKSKVFNNTQSGSALANETIIHLAVHGLPFGGLGPSGSGYNTGKYGFDSFTHLRATIDNPNWVDLLMNARYPPYSSGKINRVVKAMGHKLPARPGTSKSILKRWGFWAALALAGLITKVGWRGIVPARFFA